MSGHLRTMYDVTSFYKTLNFTLKSHKLKSYTLPKRHSWAELLFLLRRG